MRNISNLKAFIFSMTIHIACVLSVYIFSSNSFLNTHLKSSDKEPIHFVLYQSQETVSQEIKDLESFSEKIKPIQKKSQIINQSNIQTPDQASKEESNQDSGQEYSQEYSNESGPRAGLKAQSLEQKYIAEIKYLLNQKKRYPMLAKKMGQSGSVKIQFEIDDQGRIIKSQIIETSEHKSLNDSVLSLLQEIKKFKPIPSELKKNSWVFALPVEYKL